MISLGNNKVSNETYKDTASDSAETIADAKKTNGDVKCTGALITVEDNAIRFCLGGSTPTQAGLGHILSSGDSIRLSSYGDVDTFSYINETNASNAVLQITILF